MFLLTSAVPGCAIMSRQQENESCRYQGLQADPAEYEVDNPHPFDHRLKLTKLDKVKVCIMDTTRLYLYLCNVHFPYLVCLLGFVEACFTLSVRCKVDCIEDSYAPEL